MIKILFLAVLAVGALANAPLVPDTASVYITPVSAAGFRYTGDASHPSIVETFRRSIATIAGLPCDVLLSTHPGTVRMDEKLSRRLKGEADSFVDDKACRAYAETGTRALDARIAGEK